MALRRGRPSSADMKVAGGKVAMQGNVAVGALEDAIDGWFFAPFLPDAVIIMLASPLSENTERLEVKLRLGRAAPAGLSLHELNIRGFDPAYGGRWNAGSNKREGGTSLTLANYVEFLRASLERWMNGCGRVP